MKRYGWFEYSENPRTITNYLTGQKLAVVSGDISASLPELICEYSDSEISHPIYISIGFGGSNGTSIQCDYGRAFQTAPAYGYWRRIDDFLTDALLGWPEFVFKPVWFTLTVIGGWRSSCWQPQLKRVFSGRKSGTPEQIAHYPISEPYLILLSIALPGGWHYVDLENPSPKADLHFKCVDPLNIPHINSTDKLSGFQGLVPYLEREDQQAYIFPALIEPYALRGEDPVALVWYTYADENIFFTFRSHPIYDLELSYCKDYGFRQLPPQREYWPNDGMGNLVPGDMPRGLTRASYLSYRVWRQVTTTIRDAWPTWKTPPRKIEIDSSVVLPETYGKSAYVGNFGPTISHGYCAGMVNSWFQLS